jgi:AcrR family transcriptional regulator
MADAWELRLPDTDSSKEERFHKVAEVVATLVLRSGRDGLKVATVARRSGVSRAWIYKYFGPDPAALVAFAIRLYGEAFSDLASSRSADNVAEWREIVAQATHKGLRDALAAPWCIQVYFRYRHSPDEIGEAIRDLETRYIERSLEELPSRLRADRARAQRFVEFFTGTRLGAFHRWLDPKVRSRVTEDQAVLEILRPLDQFVASYA